MKFHFILLHLIFQCVGMGITEIPCMAIFIALLVPKEHTVTCERLLTVHPVLRGKPPVRQEVIGLIVMSVRGYQLIFKFSVMKHKDAYCTGQGANVSDFINFCSESSHGCSLHFCSILQGFSYNACDC